jgi:hypothetical protein
VKSIAIGITLLLIAGCTAHYHQVRNDRARLFLRVPDATSVYFAYSVNRFRPQRTDKTKWGSWRIDVPATQEFTYFYSVDGVVFVPDCKLKEKDDFGGENCIFVPNM